MGFRIISDESAYDHFFRKDNTISIIEREWRPAREFYFVVKFDFEPKYWMIPGVVYCGNRFGHSIFPRPSLNKPWFFREDRCTIPSAGIVEDDKYVLAVFVEPARNEDELSAVSVQRDRIVIRIPWMEIPRRYVCKNGFSRPKKRYFDNPIRYRRKFYIVYANYRELGYERGYYLVLEKVWRLFNWREPIMSQRLKTFIMKRISFAINVHLVEVLDRISFVQFVFCGTPISGSSVSGGFVGKSMELALALYRIYLLGGDIHFRDVAFKIANFHCEGLRRGGVFLTDYFLSTRKYYGYALLHRKWINTRLVGETLYYLLRLYQLSRTSNDENELWLLVPMRVGLFFVRNQPEYGGFGKWWLGRRILIEEGTNGVYIIWLLSKLYEITKEKIFLRSAQRAMRYYTKKFVENDIYWGDTLDANAIDKEGAHAILRASLMLYTLTKNREYLDIARRAAYYFLTWMFFWDVPFNKRTMLGSLGFKTRGWTVASVENQHLDPYGIIVAPDLLLLYKHTGANLWKDTAIAMTNAVINFVFPKANYRVNRIFNGFQPEQIYHTDWRYIPLLDIICQLFTYGSIGTGGKGYAINNVLWTASSAINAALDIAELLGISLNNIKIKWQRGYLFKLFKFLQKIFTMLNIFF